MESDGPTGQKIFSKFTQFSVMRNSLEEGRVEEGKSILRLLQNFKQGMILA